MDALEAPFSSLAALLDPSDELAERCAREGRYDFFLTSKPLNGPGGVGSPPNALAFF